MLLTFLIMLLVVALGIGWGVYTNVSMYKHGAIRTQNVRTLSRATSVASRDLYSAQVDEVYDINRRYFQRAMTFLFFTIVMVAFFIALLLNSLSW